MNLSFRHLDPMVPSETAPLLVLLHGFGANMDDLLPLGHALDPRFRVVAAEAPLDLGPMGMPGGRAWFSLIPTAEGLDFDRDEAAAAAAAASAFVSEAVERWGGGGGGAHVLGFSQGAMMTHAMLLGGTAPVASAIGCSGRMIESLFTDEAQTAESLRDRPVFVSHGRQDEVIPVASGRAIRDWYAKSPADLTYHEYDMGHGIGPECLMDLQRWISPRLG